MDPEPDISSTALGLEDLCSYSDINITALNIIIGHFGEDGLRNHLFADREAMRGRRYTPIINGDKIIGEEVEGEQEVDEEEEVEDNMNL